MSTCAALIALVRGLIPELSAIEWTDPRLLLHLDSEHKEWAATLGQQPGPGWFTIEVTFTLPASATTYALTGLLNATTEGSFAAFKDVWYLPASGGSVRVESAKKGQEERFRLGVGESEVGQACPMARWLSRPAGVPTLNMHPASSVSRSFRAYIRYEPPTLTLGGSVQTDPRHDDVLVMGAALRALLETSETDPVIAKSLKDLKDKFIEAERNADGEFESETTKVADYGSESMFES